MRRFSLLSGLVSLGLTTGAASAATLDERQGLTARIDVPAAVLEAVKTALPDGRAVNQAYLSPAFDPNLLISVRSSVSVTFLADGALYRNSLGYFTYAYDGAGIRIIDRGLVFPNTSAAGSRGSLVPGDTAPLRDVSGQVRYFEPGTRIGFFLVSDGWNGSGVKGWTPEAPELPSITAGQNHSVLTSLEQLNPETAAGKANLARHVAMIGAPGVDGFLAGQPFLLMGMEDVRRDQGSDEDFNDLVFVIHAATPAALSTTHVPTYSSLGDPDGDGVSGLNDAFPNDPSRATVTTTTISLPASTLTTNSVLNGQGDTKDLVTTFDRQASRTPAAITLPGLPLAAEGSVRIERFDGAGSHSEAVSLRMGDFTERQDDGTLMLRIPAAFPGSEGSGVESTRVVVTFDKPVRLNSKATWQLDPAAASSPKPETAPHPWLREWSIGVGQ